MNRYLNDVKAEHAFVLSHGGRLKNVHELKKALFTMGLATFHHHVSDGKNDFATWVHDCIKDSYLAEKMAATTSKDHMAKVVAERINELTRQRQSGEHLPKGPLDDPLATDHIIQEIEMLSKGFSTERVISQIKTENMVTNIGRGYPDNVKESDAGIVVIKRQGAAPAVSNTTPLFDFSSHAKAPSGFLERLNRLIQSIESKDKDSARRLYTELKGRYESTALHPADRKAVHSILMEAYNDILKL